MIDTEFQGIVNGLAILRELSSRRDEIRKLVLRQRDCFSTVSLKCSQLPEPFSVCFCFCLEEHSPLAPRTQIEYKRMCLTVFISPDFQIWPFHAEKSAIK